MLHTILGTAGYMAPEQHRRKPYEGKSIDIFAAGVILFIMVARHPPFSKAIAKDNFYQYIGRNKPETFWKKMKSGKSKNYFSNDFMDLV